MNNYKVPQNAIITIAGYRWCWEINIDTGFSDKLNFKTSLKM